MLVQKKKNSRAIEQHKYSLIIGQNIDVLNFKNPGHFLLEQFLYNMTFTSIFFPFLNTKINQPSFPKKISWPEIFF